MNSWPCHTSDPSSMACRVSWLVTRTVLQTAPVCHFSGNSQLSDEQQTLSRKLTENCPDTFFGRNGPGGIGMRPRQVLTAILLKQCNECRNVV